MVTKLRLVIILTVGLACTPLPADAAGPPVAEAQIVLSADLLTLLRAEMQEIAAGVQGIALSLASADWKSIEETSAKIRASYLMEKALTAEQSRELEHALPEQFRQLDAGFHQRAAWLGKAAEARDPELVAFRYSRLLESCAGCHSIYARARFPGFAPAAQMHPHH